MNANAVSSASRAGARIASSEPVASTFATDAATQVAAALSNIEKSAVTNIWVYSSLDDGTPEGGSTCSSKCFKFTLSPTGVLSGPSGGWSFRMACTGTALDKVGVSVEYTHKSAVGFLFEGKKIKEFTTMQLEPIPSTSPCKSA